MLLFENKGGVLMGFLTKKNIKKLLILIVAITFVLSMAACGKTEDEGSQGEAKSSENVEITALLEGHPTSNALKQLASEFEEQTGIKVNLEIVPYSELTSKALLSLSQKSDRYDVIMDDWVHGVGYAKAGYLESLDEYESISEYYDPDDFVTAYSQTPRFEGKLYGLPVYGESTFLMYRKDLFDKYNIPVPKTMDDLYSAAITIKNKTDGEIAGITLRGEQGIHNVYSWATFLWSFGGQWFDEDGKCVIDSPEGIKATEFYVKLLNDAGPIGVSNFGWEENRLAFTQGRAAMIIDATVNGAFNEDPENSSVAGKVGYAPSPVQSKDPNGGANSLAVHNLYMSSFSKNKEAAWKFITWATSKQTQEKMLDIEPSSGISSKSAMGTDIFVEKYGAFKDAMLEALDKSNSNYLPQIPEANEIINITGTAISQVLVGTANAKDALTDAAAQINNILNQ